MSAPVHQKLWEHKSPHSTKTYEFKKVVEEKYKIQLEDYKSLHQWSVGHLAQFWEEVWHFTGIRASAPFIKVGNRRDMYTRFTLNLASDFSAFCSFLCGEWSHLMSNFSSFFCG